MTIPKQFKSNYLTQQMAMVIGRKLSRNDFYHPDIDKKIKRLLIEPIEKESGRGFQDVLNYINTLELNDFINKCKKLSK